MKIQSILLFVVSFIATVSMYCAQKTKVGKYKYPQILKDFARKQSLDTAVVIVGFNRPHYFKEVIDALDKNPESQMLPFFFILDGGVKAKQKEYEALIRNSSIKQKYIIKRPFNYGLNWNMVAALRLLFDWCGFKRVLHFEDDVVTTSSYIGLVLRLDDWAHAHYKNIGAVQAFFPSRMSLEEKIKKNNIVMEYPGLMLGYCMRSTAWNTIKPLLLEYEKQFLKGKKWKPQQVKAWISHVSDKACPVNGQTKQSPDYWPAHPEFCRRFARLDGCQSQEAIITSCFLAKGMNRLATIATRATSIGRVGDNFNERLWNRHFGGITVEEMPEESKVTNFIPDYTFYY